MEEDHREIIRKNRVYLVETLDVTKTSLLDHLVQEGVLSQRQHAGIKDKYSLNNQLVSAVLDHLDMRTRDDWLTFLKCVSRCGQDHIVTKVSDDPEVKRLQCLLAEKILEFHNTTEIWQKEDEFKDVSIDDIFVDLEISKINVDGGSNVEEEKLGGYQDIYSELLKNRTVFTFGPPGTGKSTLSKRLCCDWAKLQEENAMDIDDLNLHNFSFILPISLPAVRNNKTFQEYVREAYNIKKKDAQALFNCIEKKQESVVLVLDEKENYDEGTSAEMTRLLYRKLFPKVKMLITSRSLSLPAFCNYSYLPIATLSLQGFSDEGVKLYARKLYRTEADQVLNHLDTLEYGRNVKYNPAFLTMLLRITSRDIHNNTTEYCKEHVAYTIRRAKRKRKMLMTPDKSVDQILREHRAFINLLGQLVTENVKAEKMETKFSQEQVRKYQTQSDDLMFEFLIEHKEENGETIYMFTHRILQEFFLTYFLVTSDFSDLKDILLEFCGCRDAFFGTRVVEIIMGLNYYCLEDDYLEDAMRTICNGDDRNMAELHTNLQLDYVEKYKDFHLVLPELMYLSARDNRFPWNRYLAMEGSHLVKLTLKADDDILNSLHQLNAPNLSSLTILVEDPCSALNGQQIERTLSRFSLKKLEIHGSILNLWSTIADAAVTAACKLPGVEELMFILVSIESEQMQHLAQCLQGTVLKTLTVSRCFFRREQIFELVDAVSTSAGLECLDISSPYSSGIVDKLVDITEKFKHLKKLNLMGNWFSKEEKKREIKEKLEMYPQLELNI